MSSLSPYPGIKNDILRLAYDDSSPIGEQEKQKVRQLVEDIHLFKRVNQRFRGYHTAKARGRSGKRVVREEVEVQERDDGGEAEGGDGEGVSEEANNSRMPPD